MSVFVRTERQAERFSKMKLLGSKGKNRNGEVYINVTALVDMMTVLVIFLIMQFSATGEMLFISKDLKMAGAENGAQVTRVPILSINALGELFFEGSVIVAKLSAPGKSESWEIPELAEKLRDNRKRFDALGTQRASQLTSADPTTTVNIQIDRNIDYGILKRILHTCETEGYERIRLAVGSESKVHAEKEINVKYDDKT